MKGGSHATYNLNLSSEEAVKNARYHVSLVEVRLFFPNNQKWAKSLNFSKF